MLLPICLLIFVMTQGSCEISLASASSMCLGDGRNVYNNLELTTNEKVKFEFYYETGCGPSKWVYINRLDDAVNTLAPYIDISTYPYGNAQMFLNESQLVISCQHKEAECYGNRLHACAIDALKEPVKYVSFNACMIRFNTTAMSDDKAADACANKMKIDSKGIKSCAKGLRGFQLLLYYGIESGKAPYHGVPFWFVNGVPRSTDINLKKVICNAFKNPPEVCKI